MEWNRQLIHSLKQWRNGIQNNSYFTEEIHVIDKLISDIDEPLTIMIIGMFNSGKSTFINAFLGVNLLKSDVLAATAKATKISYGEESKVIGFFLNGTQQEFSLDVLNEIASESEGAFGKVRDELDYIEVKLPLEILKKMTIVDSPGLDAGIQSHTKATETFMDRADFALFVFSYHSVYTKQEAKIIDSLKEKDIKTIGIINQIDRHDEEEQSISNYMSFQKRHVDNFIERLIPVSAINALKAKLNNNAALYKSSNWDEINFLFDELQQNTKIKTQRIFTKLLVHMKMFENIIINQKNKTPIYYYGYAMEQFLHTRLPEITNTYMKIQHNRDKTQNSLDYFNHLLNKSNLDLNDVNSIINNLITESPHGEIFSGISKDYYRVCVEPFKDMHNFRNEILEHLNMLVKERERVIRDWDYIKKKTFFKKGTLDRLKMNQISYNQKRKEMNYDYENLIKEQNHVFSRIKRFIEKLNKQLTVLHFFYIDQLIQDELLWEETVVKYEREFKKIPIDNIEMIVKDERTLKLFQNTLGRYFCSTHSEIVGNEQFQEGKYLTKRIQNILPSIPHSKYIDAINFLENKKLLIEVESKNEPIKLINISHLIELSSLSIPAALQLPIQSEINHINTFRKKLAGGIVACSLLTLGFLNRDLIFNTTDEEVIENLSINEFNEVEMEEIDNGVTITEGVESVTEIQVNEDYLAEFMLAFRNAYLDTLITNDFSLIDLFLRQESPAYYDLYNYLAEISNKGYTFEFEENTITSMYRVSSNYYEVGINEILLFTNAQGIQTRYFKEKLYTIFLIEDGKFEIENIKTSNTRTEPIVAQSEPVETVFESEPAFYEAEITSFILNYQTDYTIAFNEYGFENIQYYFESNGSEFEKAKQRILIAQENNTKIENQYLEVQSVQYLDSNQYLVTMISEDRYDYQDGTAIFQRTQTEYLLKPGVYDQLLIQEITNQELLEETIL